MKSFAPLAAFALTSVLLALPAHAQRPVSIQAHTAGDLAELCSANPRDPMGDARINFCHGFTQGAITAELRHAGGRKPFCFPSPAPSRSATLGEFANWVRAMPDRMTLPAVDGFFQFLGERYPCK